MAPAQRFAQLPMYDWPEVSKATDGLWTSIRDAFSCLGIDAPDALNRSLPAVEAWLSPGLVLSQTCGLPLVAELSGKVQVLGSFAYEGIEPAGSYHSVIITRTGNDPNPMHLAAKRAAINGDDSYSGCLALKCFFESLGAGEAFFDSTLISGGHRASLCAVADGRADLAAIDCVSWDLANRCEPAVGNLQIIARTASRPGLPLITHGDASAKQVSLMRDALAKAVGNLDAKSRLMTGIRGFVPLDEADYAPIAEDLKRCGSLALADQP